MSESLAEQARAIIEANPQGYKWREVLYAHLRNGWYVWASPTALALGRPVMAGWSDEELWGLEKSALAEDADCWHIWIAVGDVLELLERLPFELPSMSFQHRGHEVKRLSASRVRKLLHRYGKRTKAIRSTASDSARAAERP